MADCKNRAIWKGVYCDDCWTMRPGGNVEWWCASGVTHSATNSLSLDVIGAIGDSTDAVRAFVCTSSTDQWGHMPKWDECSAPQNASKRRDSACRLCEDDV